MAPAALVDAASRTGTPVFSRLEECVWLTPAVGADTFARSERTATAYSRTGDDVHGTKVRVLTAGREFAFRYRGGQLPRWARRVFESIAARWGNTHGWDGYRAQPTDPTLVAKLLNCLQLVMSERATAPTITPLADGGVQAEWHKGDTSLEIIVPAAEESRFYFYDAQAGTEREGVFHENADVVGQLISAF